MIFKYCYGGLKGKRYYLQGIFMVFGRAYLFFINSFCNILSYSNRGEPGSLHNCITRKKLMANFRYCKIDYSHNGK